VGANFTSVGFSGSNGGSNFTGADLENANFTLAQFQPGSASQSVTFANANLYNANFTGAFFHPTIFTHFPGANLECATFDASVVSSGMDMNWNTATACPDGTAPDATTGCNTKLTRHAGCP